MSKPQKCSSVGAENSNKKLTETAKRYRKDLKLIANGGQLVRKKWAGNYFPELNNE
jgi:hypothetical protein